MADHAPGSSLFQIRRVFALCEGGRDAAPWPRHAQVAALAVHTLEKKQLLALAVSPAPMDPAAVAALAAGPGGAKAAAAAAKAAQTVGNFLLLRTVEEDRRARLWRLPVSSTPKQQRAGKTERLVALEFSPEGDWLAALSSRKNRFHLIPVLALIARQRRALLDASYRPPHNRELLSVTQSVMNAQMASYLRATNEFGGMNGARYHSQVAGDDEQMSTLEFGVGMGDVTCVRWWRSFNGKNYCLVGGAESLVSIVNVEENAEECRCELADAGAIESIDLILENFRRESRTSMLVKARGDDAVVRYYRVVLEKKYQAMPPKGGGKAAKTGGEDKASSSDDDAMPSNQFTMFSGGNRAPKFVVKTFPEHFLQDMDFRPQRIKKNTPHVQLFAINGLMQSASSMALYDSKLRKVNLYSNFHWSLKGAYEVPNLLASGDLDTKTASQGQADDKSSQQPVEGSGEKSTADKSAEGGNEGSEVGQRENDLEVELTYCSSDLMLLQAHNTETSKTISTWVSLPSHQSFDDEVASAHIVHYLSLHNNEKVERVVQSTARGSSDNDRGRGSQTSSDSEVIYILQTKHNVYECRPQWSRVALFKALCAHSIALPNALSIGYALGIDMASLCQVAANTLYDNAVQGKATCDATFLSWMRDLFEVSRSLPSTAVRQLTAIGGATYAIEYAKDILAKPPREFDYDSAERSRVAFLLVDLLLQPRLDVDNEVDGKIGETQEQAPGISSKSDERDEWLLQFLVSNGDYDAAEVVDLCLEHQRVDIAIRVGMQREEVAMVLDKIIAAGLAAFVPVTSVQQLCEANQAAALTAPASRLIWSSLPLEVQIHVLLAYHPAIFQLRDWVTRHMMDIPVSLCRQLTEVIDSSRTAPAGDEDTDPMTAIAGGASAKLPLEGVSSSEFIRSSPEERIELFLTAVLRLNWSESGDATNASSHFVVTNDAYSQAKLEAWMTELADKYRPPIMVARCIDYGNWSAAACIYEANGELVEALECRLNAKKALQVVSSTTVESALSPTDTVSKKKGKPRRRQFSIESDGLAPEEAERQDAMREELLELLNSLVVQRHDEKRSSERLRAAILARLLVKWVESGLGRTELEVFLVDPNVYPHVSALLAAIFFSDLVAAVGGNGSGITVGDDEQSDTAVGQFDDRDKEWVAKCHALEFSGQFLFRVCTSFLERGDLAVTAPLPAAINPQDTPTSPTMQLLNLVKDNIVGNDVAHTAVRIGPHSAQALGKSDPLETHVKVFTCGHVFPKRVFDDEVVPEFEKRMNALPVLLLTTKQLFAREFRRSVAEAPCPVCSFNKICELVHEHLVRERLQQQEQAADRRGVRRQHKTPGLYFLHQSASERSSFSASSSRLGRAQQLERWEWREQMANTNRAATTATTRTRQSA